MLCKNYIVRICTFVKVQVTLNIFCNFIKMAKYILEKLNMKCSAVKLKAEKYEICSMYQIQNEF